MAIKNGDMIEYGGKKLSVGDILPSPLDPTAKSVLLISYDPKTRGQRYIEPLVQIEAAAAPGKQEKTISPVKAAEPTDPKKDKRDKD